MKANYNEFINSINETLTEGLKKDGLKWFKDWKVQYECINGATNTHYHGANLMRLSLNGFSDSRYFTFKQANDKGYKVKKGAKSQTIVKFAYWDNEEKRYLTHVEYNELKELDNINGTHRAVMFMKTYNVFNAEQLEGIELEPQTKTDLTFDFIANLCKAMDLKVETGTFYSTPCYVPSEDTIYLPNISTFTSQSGLYATALHEISHATNHPTRLNREVNFNRESKEYALEELIAEISATILCNYLGIENEVTDNHQAYINSWFAQLKDDNKYFVNAFKKAEEVAKYIIELIENNNIEVEEVEKTSSTEENKTAFTFEELKNTANFSALKEQLEGSKLENSHDVYNLVDDVQELSNGDTWIDYFNKNNYELCPYDKYNFPGDALSITRPACIQIELRCGKHLRVYGDVELYGYDLDEKVYQCSSFYNPKKVEIC